MKPYFGYLILFYLVTFQFHACTDDKDILLESIINEDISINDVGDEDDSQDDSQNDENQNQSGTEDNQNDETQANQSGTEDDQNDEESSENTTGNLTIEIATWKNFANSAISHTWDDAYSEQIEIAVPLYNTYGMNTTLFVLPNKIKNWEPYKEAFEDGHEIASHTLTHPSLDDLTQSEVEYELKESKDIIVQQMGYNDCLTLAYPYCHEDSFNLSKDFYIAARSCQGRIEKSTPDDFMKISSFLCGQGSSYYTSNQLNSIAESALEQKGWGVYMFHLIDGNGGYSIDSSALNQHLNYLSNNSDDYWVDTFLNVVKYIKERNAVNIAVVEQSETQIILSCSDNLDDDIYDSPITFKFELPSNWFLNNSNLNVFQGTKACEYYYLNQESKNYIVVNAVPDRGNIIIQP